MKKDACPFSLVFLAGGVGTRMGSSVPKQYLELHHKPLALYSFEVFLSLPEIMQIVVVCDLAYEAVFRSCGYDSRVVFTRPGRRRQDSVFHGIQKLSSDPLVCIHDSARPLISQELVRRAVHTASEWGAATLGTPIKSTIKICDSAHLVVSTPERSHIWEIQTPQVVRLNLLKEGFHKAYMEELTVTDDVSLVELLGKPVKIVESTYHNIKVTTPEDFALAEYLLEKHALLQVNNYL